MPMPAPKYPESLIIDTVIPDKYKIHKGDSDMWPLTWGADDVIYAAGGDIPGSPLNTWKVTGDPSFFASLVVDMIDRNPLDLAEYCRKDPRISPIFGLKPSGLISISGTLYFAVSTMNVGEEAYWWRQRYLNAWIMTSTDCGQTWNEDATPLDFFGTRLSGPSFLQFGKDYDGARDEYVYAYFPVAKEGYSVWENGDFILLGRVSKDQLLERKAWSFYAGTGSTNSPDWTADENAAVPIFEYSKMTGQNHVCYNPGLKRYIMGNYSFTDMHGNPRPYHANMDPKADPQEEFRFPSQLTLFEAPEPWGPWSQFYRDDNWGTYGDYQPNFPTKWISEDGLTMYMVSSGSYDDYNFTVQKITLKLTETAAKG